MGCILIVSQKKGFEMYFELCTNSDEFWKAWEENLNSMCEEIEECAGATNLVQALASTGLPLAIATSSRYAGVEKKRIR